MGVKVDIEDIEDDEKNSVDDNKHEFTQEELRVCYTTIDIIISIIYIINTVYFIKGMGWQEDYSFLNTGTKQIFFMVWYFILVVITACCHCTSICYGLSKKNLNDITTIWFLILFGLPTIIFRFYRPLEYDFLCKNFIYEIEIHDMVVKFKGDDIFTIKTINNFTDNSITVQTGPMPVTEYITLSTKFGGDDGLRIPFDYESIDLYNSSLVSVGIDKWYSDKAHISGMTFMKLPNRKRDIYKICSNEFYENILRITTIIPVLHTRYKTCSSCMKSCMTRCKKWDFLTREKKCIVYYSYNDCKGPPCSSNHTCHGITL